jgi:hypothetical protein
MTADGAYDGEAQLTHPTALYCLSCSEKAITKRGTAL